MNRANYELYAASPAVRAFREFPGRTHYTLGQPAGRRSPTPSSPGPWTRSRADLAAGRRAP